MTTIDWTALQHAYGSAGDIPALLDRARSARPPDDYTSEPWFTLWSALFHQDDIYSASYAAVPELVAIAAERGGEVAAEALLLAASIELRRNQPGAPEVPLLLRDDYHRALIAARPITNDLARRPPDPDGKVAIADAVFRGDMDRAREMMEGDGEEPDE